MKRIYECLVIVLLAITISGFTVKQDNNHLEGKVLNYSDVLVTINQKYTEKKYSIYDFEKYHCNGITDLTSSYTKKLRNLDFKKIYKLSFPVYNEFDLKYILQNLSAREEIDSCEPSYVVENTPSIDTYKYIPENDYDPEKQYTLELLELPLAWDIAKYADEVKVAVIDSGVDNTHVELQWKVDTKLSKSFSSAYSEQNPYEDKVPHGTPVASVIAAESNNFNGFIGVAFNASIISLKVTMSLANSWETEAVIKALNYCTENNIQIINYSGGSYEKYGEAQIQAFKNYNGLIIAAAGNKNKNIDEDDFYPAKLNLPNVIVVGSSDRYDNKVGDSNYGKNTVDLFAPGVDIYVAIPNNKYTHLSGTSVAAPHVTGVACLLLGIHPKITAIEMKEIICNTVDKCPSLTNYCKTGGRLNAYKAINKL